MNILNALKQLRDDIKTWVTNNLNALNTKIDEKTIPIDSELSSTSTNPVQNKAIKKAIDNIPTFSGDYNDLTNAPDISEDGSGNMIIADESGNIIFKADADGIHTTAVTINGEKAASEKFVEEAIAAVDIPETDLTGYAKESYVDEAIANIEFPETDFTGYATETYVDDKVADLVNSAPEALNTLGELAIALENHEDAYDALLETVGSKATQTDLENLKEELSESIVAESDEWKVVDEAGNIIFSVDASGAHTTELTLNGEDLKDLLDEKASKDHTHQIKNNSQVSTTGTTIAFEIEGQTFSQEVAINGGSMSVESAQRLTTGRNISLSGDVIAASVVFDGSKDIVLTTTVNNSEKLSNRPASDYVLKTDLPDTADFITMSDVEEKHYLVEADITAKKFVDESSLAAKQYATESFVADELDGLAEDLKQSILLESQDWQVVDSNNNVILSVDSDGLHTTSMTLDGESAATEKFVTDSIAAIAFPETDLSNYYTKQETESLIPDTSNFLTDIPEEYVTETELADKGFLTEHQSLDGLATTQELEVHTQDSNVHVTSADKQKWNAKSNFSGDYNDLTNAPAIAEDETGDLVIADNAGNIIFRASDQGLETTHLSIGSLTINGMTIQEMIKAYVDEAILGGEW